MSSSYMQHNKITKQHAHDKLIRTCICIYVHTQTYVLAYHIKYAEDVEATYIVLQFYFVISLFTYVN